MNWIEVVSFVITLIALSPFFIVALSKTNILFSGLKSGDIKYIFRGDKFLKIKADMEGKRVVGHKLEKGIEERNFLERWLGVFWLGTPPFLTSIKRFTIPRKKELEIFTGKAPEEWIQDLGPREVDSLRAVFPRPYLLLDAELGDRQTVHVLMVVNLEVVDAYVPVVVLKGDFFEILGSMLKGMVLNIIENVGTMDAFIAADKGEGGILSVLVSDAKFNDALIKQTGLRVTSASIPQWDPSNPEVRKAMSAKFIAEKEKEARIATAEAYSKEREIKASADLEATMKDSEAKGLLIKAVRDNINVKEASPNVVVEETAKVLMSENQKGLLTRVESGAQVVVGGNK